LDAAQIACDSLLQHCSRGKCGGSRDVPRLWDDPPSATPVRHLIFHHLDTLVSR
jgi:hypothetical protein